MKHVPNLLLILLCTLFIEATRHSPDPVVFWASTPCDGYPRSFFSIPATADCEFIKWTLNLQHHPRTQEPTTFKLSYTWGLSRPSTEELMNGGTQGIKEGTWSSKQGSGNKVIYQLTQADVPNRIMALVRLDDHLLHLLDEQGKLMIGHAGWSYTLNRK